MILNTFAILALLFVALLIVAGASLGSSVWRAARRPRDFTPDGGDPARPLTLLLVGLIAGLALASVALWGLLLESYVPQWEGLRCAVGVLRVGTDSEGAPGWLPGLARASSILLPVTLFAAGLGIVLHALGRARPEERLRPAHLAILAIVAVLAVATGATEAAWIIIPKAERFLAAGCCTTTPSSQLTQLSAAAGAGPPDALAALFAVPTLALSGLLIGWPARRAPSTADLLRVACAVAVAAAGYVFARDVVAPEVLSLPLHRCSLCLAADAPEAALGMGLLFVPLLATGWRAAGRVLGGAPAPAFEPVGAALDRVALAGALGGLFLLTTMWWIA